MDTSKDLLDCFLQGKFQRMICPQCENTFLTNVYEMKCLEHGKSLSLKCATCQRTFTAETSSGAWKNYVILEKYALGLEYFYDAIQQYELTQVPFIQRIGVLDEENQILDPTHVRLYKHEEPDYRIIYLMEKLEHLDEADSAFFTDHVYGMDWKEKPVRQEILGWIRERYSAELAEDIRKLCLYFREHEDFLAWDLHGDNIMRRVKDGSLVVMDPFAIKMGA